MTRNEIISDAARQGKHIGVHTIDLLARAGFLTKGVLYMIVGVLALGAAAGFGGRVTGTRGALLTVLQQPYGRTLLLIAAIGLIGYAVWRVIQGVLDRDHEGGDWRGMAVRISYVARGFLHAALGYQAFRLYNGLSMSGGSSERRVAQEALRWPLGDWLLVLAGLSLIGFAVYQLYAAAKCKLEPKLDISRFRREAGEWAVFMSRFGIASRGVVFAMLGWFIVNAGWMHDASQVGAGTASSMRAVAEQAGTLGLGITAAGFVAYGFYQIMHALYLRIRL